jgi:xanthine dehydrogenase YagR molybdenum-binding subunit
MAAAAYPIAFFRPEQRARARLHADGSAVVQMAAVEFGTGALMMATQVAADALGLEPHAVEFRAADSDLPTRPRRSAPPAPA